MPDECTMDTCPATREAIWEQEDTAGEVGCPICGRDAQAHKAEMPFLPTSAEWDRQNGRVFEDER